MIPKIWFTSDEHFSHENIIKYCNRPFANAHEMDRALSDNWNSKVGPRDRVYVLGDFTMGNVGLTERRLKSLAGEKYLIKGNHDRGSLEKLVEAGFAWAGNELQYQLGPYLVLLSHYPYGLDAAEQAVNQRLRRIDKFASKRPKDKGNWILHGHVHTAWKIKGRQINVGVDRWDYSPVSTEQLVDLIESGGKPADRVGAAYDE